MQQLEREVAARAILIEVCKFFFLVAVWACLPITAAVVITLGALWFERMFDGIARGLAAVVTGSPEVDAPRDQIADILGWEASGLFLWLIVAGAAAVGGYFLRPYATVLEQFL
jgi:hypothetical protein